jgi:hypothetical protein
MMRTFIIVYLASERERERERVRERERERDFVADEYVRMTNTLELIKF